MKMLTQRMMWLGMVLVLIVLTVFGVAMMGSVLGSKPKEIPVALVILDQPAELPTGGTFSIGEMIREKLLSSPAMPFVWHVVDSEEKAREGLDKREYYGAMVIPADLSSGLLSLATHSPIHPNVRIISNEGMNTQASMVVGQAIGQAMKMINGELLQQLLGQIGQQTEQIPVETAKALMTPVNVQEEVVHPPGVNNASGNAPGLLTQIIWIGSMVTGVVLFLASQKAVAAGSRRWTVSALQAIGGLAIVGIASCFTIWMASSWYGMELANAGETWLFLWLAGSAFFLLAIFLAELDRIPGNTAARTADVLLHAAAEHGSGVLVTDDERLDLFVDATAVRGRRATGSNVLRRTGRSSLKRLDFVGRRRWIFGLAAHFRI